MSSTFKILESSRSGLNAAQLGLSVTGQNIANADTEGYTRQSINVSAKSPDTGSYRAANSAAKVGQGVSVDSVYQIRDTFLDVRYRYSNSTYNTYNSMKSQLSPIEDQFNEFGSTTTTTNKLTGLSGILDQIYTTLNEGETDSTSTTISSAVETNVNYLVSTIRSDAAYLKELLNTETEELNIYVSGGAGDTSNGDYSGGINGIIENIQNLNAEIASYEITGEKANDLRDQRNLLLDDLSSYIDIDTTEQQNGVIIVKLKNDNSKYIIDSSNDVNEFTTGIDPTSGAMVLQWGDSLSHSGTRTAAATAQTANVKDGIIKAYLNVINGDGSGTDDSTVGQCGNLGIPYLQQKLDDFAKAIADIMNNTDGKVIDTAYTKDADTASPTYGTVGVSTKLLTYDPGDIAGTISVSDAWTADSDLFLNNYAGASVTKYYQAYIDALKSTTGLVSVSATDGSGTSSPYSGTLIQFADSFTQEIASAVSVVSAKASAASITADNLDDQRKSISSVSINDEGVNLIKYQQAYNANARVITAIDEMLDKLINGTGEVGLG